MTTELSAEDMLFLYRRKAEVESDQLSNEIVRRRTKLELAIIKDIIKPFCVRHNVKITSSYCNMFETADGTTDIMAELCRFFPNDPDALAVVRAMKIKLLDDELFDMVGYVIDANFDEWSVT